MNDPEPACYIRSVESTNKRPERIDEIIRGRFWRQTEYRNPGVLAWAKQQWITEINIKCDKAPLLRFTYFDQCFIGGSTQSFFYNSGNIMTCLS